MWENKLIEVWIDRFHRSTGGCRGLSLMRPEDVRHGGCGRWDIHGTQLHWTRPHLHHGGRKLTPCFPQPCVCGFTLSGFQKLQAELLYLCVCPSIQLFSPQQTLLRSHC